MRYCRRVIGVLVRYRSNHGPVRMDLIVSSVQMVLNISPPPLSEEFWGAPSTGNCDNVTVPNRYPLMEELFALNELVDNMRVDLLQGSMLLDYIKDYLQKNTHQ